jgi:hypothetical protein
MPAPRAALLEGKPPMAELEHNEAVDGLKQSVALAIEARCLINRAFKTAGYGPPSLAELRRLSREFQVLEALVPASWIALIERAGDGEALEGARCRVRAPDQPVH